MVSLRAGDVELPERNGVAQQQRQDNEEKAKRQAGTDIETVQVKSAIAKLFRPSTKFAAHLGLLLPFSIARSDGQRTNSNRRRRKAVLTNATTDLTLLGFIGPYSLGGRSRLETGDLNKLLFQGHSGHRGNLFANQNRMQCADVCSANVLVFLPGNNGRTRNHAARVLL